MGDGADNSGDAPGRKPRGRPWKKGQSGNPGGKKPIPVDVKEALVAACPKAVARLIELIASDNERIALDAADRVIERVLGKPVQPLAVSGDLNVKREADHGLLTAEELELLDRAVQRLAGSRENPSGVGETEPH